MRASGVVLDSVASWGENMWIGNRAPASTIHFLFTTRDDTGLPATLAGTPAISVYKAASDTQSTAGVTLEVDADSRTGMNRLTIDTSADGTFFSAGSDFSAVITTGTVDSISVVGEVVCTFRLEASGDVSADVAAIKERTDNLPDDPADQSAVEAAITAATADIAAIKAKTDNLPSDPADASVIAAEFVAVDAALVTIAGYLDTEVAAIVSATTAIKAKTDQFVFTVANQVDANALTGGGGLDAAGVRAALGMADDDLDDQLDAILAASGGAAGAGAVTWTVTVNDGVNPLDGAEVWISTDSAGSNVVAGTLHTDASGIATFYLDAGTYYLWVAHSGYNGTNPTAITVA